MEITNTYTMSVRNFVSKNMVVIVMVPFLIGAHYGWMKLQSIESLVPAKERDNLPPVIYLISKIFVY